MFLSSRSVLRPLALLALLAPATPARAQVTISCDQAQVTSRVPCILTAAHSDGVPRTWRWRVVGLEDAGQLLQRLAPNRVRVKTPVTLVERAFTVVAEDVRDPTVTGTFVLRISPNPAAGAGERSLAEGLFPGAFTPSLRPLLGHPERDRLRAQGEADWVGRAMRIAFCDDPAMGVLDRCWIMAGTRGLEAFKLTGEPVAIPGFSWKASSWHLCRAVAALPPGPGEVPAGAPRLVFCDVRVGPGEGVWIYALEADGRQRLLAGGEGVGHADGPGLKARFDYVNDLALDRRGNVYVCETVGFIRRIGLDGRVSTVCTPSEPTDPQGIRKPECLAVDPATGELYVGDIDRLVKFSPEGNLSRVIGGRGMALRDRYGWAPAGLRPGRVPWDTRFMMNTTSLALHGRELLLVNTDGIYAFHLDSRRVARILALSAHAGAGRMGPIPYLNPQLPPERCAAIHDCGALALTKEAMCVAQVGQGIAELELPDDPLTTVMDPKVPSPPPVPAGETKEGARELDNLWPGLALATGTIGADGAWVEQGWRSAAPGQRFSGQCRVEARAFSSGNAQLWLAFADEQGRLLEPGPPGAPEAFSAAAPGPTPLQVAGTAPAGTTRVGFGIRVIHGNAGAVVSFHDVTFHRVP